MKIHNIVEQKDYSNLCPKSLCWQMVTICWTI